MLFKIKKGQLNDWLATLFLQRTLEICVAQQNFGFREESH